MREKRKQIKSRGNFLTLSCVGLIAFVFLQEVFSQSLQIENAKTHLRWNIFTPKDNLSIKIKGRHLILKTFDLSLFNSLKKELSLDSLKKPIKGNSYIEEVKFKEPRGESNISSIDVLLRNSDVEVFNFYRERDKKHVFDFWVNHSEGDNLSKVIVKKERKKRSPSSKVPNKIKISNNKKKKVDLKKKREENKKVISLKKNREYRDFRYGASFLWNYESLAPEISDKIDLSAKTPEYFYPLVNRDYKKSDREGHLQLILNFYRKKKYGLMYKSIKLFQEKYGADKNIDFIEYIKANAIIRDHIAGGHREPLKMSINMLTAIAERTSNYDLQKAIYKYLLTYYKKSREYVESLAISKKFYVKSKESYDYEESSVAAESILYNLAMLNQVDKVSELINDPTIRKIINPGLLLSYEIFTYHKMGKIREVLKVFESKEKGMSHPIAPDILFNVAEAYFRLSRYKEAIRYFDDYISEYSYHTHSSHARLRIALSYEIEERPIKQTIILYKNAINRSQDDLISSEARIRYAALRTLRKREITALDRENRAFLDIDESIKLTKDLKELLWLVRLRTFIVDHKYREGLTYLSALPLNTLTRLKRRVFESDGAEIIYGLIQRDYINSEYGEVVKKWNKFKGIYVNKVANDAFMNFIVAQSYLKLGLYDGFDKIYSEFERLDKTPERTFPLWVKRFKKIHSKDILLELSIIKDMKLKNWDLAKRGISNMLERNSHPYKVHYYLGIIAFRERNYKDSVKEFEKYLSSQEKDKLFDPVDLASMINMYTDSLYELGMLSKFQVVAKAILDDTSHYASSSPFMKNIRERLAYLSIEIEAGKGTKKSSLLLESMISKFKRDYPHSDHFGRVNYLLGMAFSKNRKIQEAKKLFERLLNEKRTPESIKDMVRSELSLMAIRERTL